MADTIRTKAELLLLLADNSTFDISEQDMRDLLVSVMGTYGGITIGNNAAAQALVATVPVVITNWNAQSVSDGVTSDFANDRVIIVNDGDYWIDFDSSIEGITGAEFHFTLRKNGNLTGHACKIKTASNFTQAASLGTILTLVAGDELKMYVESDTNGNMVANHANLNVERKG